MKVLAASYPVAIIGVGNMGGAMASRLLSCRWPVHVCDLVAQKRDLLAVRGAVAHAMPADAVRGAVAVVVCVVDAKQSEEVLFGARGAATVMQPDQMVMLCPTMAPQDAEALARRLQERGIEVLDAPMSGGPARALDGSMSLMLAGPVPVQKKFEALIATLSSRVFRISDRVGDGAHQTRQQPGGWYQSGWRCRSIGHGAAHGA